MPIRVQLLVVRAVMLIGLTGPIGCGKSTVARMLANLGGTVIDADLLAREVTAPGEPTLTPIRGRFGDAVFASDGSLDRAAMARVVFNDADALRDLEAITHPAVRRRVDALLAKAQQDDVPFVVLEAIKLVEGGLAGRCDEVWIVDCPPSTQRERLLGRGLTARDANQRIRAQGPDFSDRLATAVAGHAHYRRIPTGGSLDEVQKQIEDALADVLEI